MFSYCQHRQVNGKLLTHRSKAMTLDYAFRMGLLADIAEDRFWSQANVVIVIAAVTGLVTLLKWVLA